MKPGVSEHETGLLLMAFTYCDIRENTSSLVLSVRITSTCRADIDSSSSCGSGSGRQDMHDKLGRFRTSKEGELKQKKRS